MPIPPGPVTVTKAYILTQQEFFGGSYFLLPPHKTRSAAQEAYTPSDWAATALAVRILPNKFHL